MLFSNYIVKTVSFKDGNGFFHRKAIVIDDRGHYIRDFSGYIDTVFIGKKFTF